MAGTEAVIKVSAMHPDIEQDCVDCAAHALETFQEQKALAQWIKRELDLKYGPTWHCICGRQFGSYVSHHDRSFLYFFIGDLGFLIWKTEPESSAEAKKMQQQQQQPAASQPRSG